VAKAVVSLSDARERAIQRLSDHFAADGFDLDEFERRVDLVHRAQAPAEIEKIIADLPALADEAVPASKALVPLQPTDEKQTVVAIMGGASRKGGWVHARRIRVVTVMGGAEIDLREVALPPGVTELKIFSFMGGAEVIVPPDLAVQMDGFSFMGGFEQMQRAPVAPEPDAPLLRISGMVMMGGVAVTTRLPGESERDARRREKAERKAQKLAGRSAQKQLEAPRDDE
jgi:hypothetical protein